MKEKNQDLERKVDAMNRNGVTKLRANIVLVRSNLKREKHEKETLKKRNDELKKKINKYKKLAQGILEDDGYQFNSSGEEE